MPPDYQKEWWAPFQLDQPLRQESPRENAKQINQKTREAMQNLTKWMKARWYLPVGAVLILLFGETILSSVIIMLLLASSVLINMQKLLLQRSIGIELVTFSASIISIAISPMFGAAFAIAAIIISQIIHGQTGTFLFVKIPSYAIMCIVASTFPPAEIVSAGIVVAFLGNAIFLTSTFFLNPERIWTNVPTAAINIILNAWLFFRFGEALLGVMMV